jgi:hypothetical protein
MLFIISLFYFQLMAYTSLVSKLVIIIQLIDANYYYWLVGYYL